jgi:carboxyl-terminal processing protease
VPFEVPQEESAKTPRFNAPREKDLSRHLENGGRRGSKDAPSVNGTAAKPVRLVEDDTKKLLDRDNQLRMALQMVRGLPKITEIHAQ